MVVRFTQGEYEMTRMAASRFDINWTQTKAPPQLLPEPAVHP
jgi:hypothetical protein